MNADLKIELNTGESASATIGAVIAQKMIDSNMSTVDLIAAVKGFDQHIGDHYDNLRDESQAIIDLLSDQV